MFGTKTRYVDSLPPLMKRVLTELSNSGQSTLPLSSLNPEISQSDLRDQLPRGAVLLRDICKPIHLNFLGRHGIRNPGQSDIKTTRNILRRLKSTEVDSKLISSLEESIAGFTVESEKELTASGWKELSSIGERFKLRFPSLFQSELGSAKEHFLFQVTSKSRTVDSCRAFMSSLHLRPPHQLHTRDDLLRFFDTCEKYVVEVDENKNALRELERFRDMNFPEIGESIASRKGVFSFAHAETLLPFISLLGLFRDDLPLTADSLHDNRRFKTSVISPFAANIALVLYSCDLSQQPHGNTVYDELGLQLISPAQWRPLMLRVLFNEQDIKLPFAQSHLVPLDQALNVFSQHLKRCDLSEICSMPKDEL
ncbi:hypothetical protein CAPTEDRAFT_228544 [Capitella teleta]|uniref:Multiple inositol polyphosphate phosphatase 1 n=1 Tax=Capitella teleta TaxID=283909 RepID=R7USG0_CAPTE|nr:hypothetical protein CAPTEDRAFT_228544 [Capitella teleta]|eukprot:ELU06862.1 hypothetical protein CAPTEDRAFT_228544 [Capitella teleta]